MKLLSRGATSIVLTPAGNDLLPKAERTLEAFGEFVECAKSQRGKIGGQLTIGIVMFDPTDIRLAAFVRQVTDRYPGIRLNLQVGRNSSFKEAVRSGKLDGAIAVSRSHDPSLAETLLQEIQFNVVIPSCWQVPSGDELQTALGSLPWIRMRPGSPHNEMILEILNRKGIKPIETVEVDHEAVIQALVSEGIGIGLLRKSLALEQQRAGRLIVLSDYYATARLTFVYAADRTADRAIGAIVDCLTSIWNGASEGDT